MSFFFTLALTGSEQLFTRKGFSAKITSGRRGQTCHIRKFSILALQSHTDLTLSTVQPRPPACRASPAILKGQRSCGSENPKHLHLGASRSNSTFRFLLDMAAAASTPPAAASQCCSIKRDSLWTDQPTSKSLDEKPIPLSCTRWHLQGKILHKFV